MSDSKLGQDLNYKIIEGGQSEITKVRGKELLAKKFSKFQNFQKKFSKTIGVHMDPSLAKNFNGVHMDPKVVFNEILLT